TVADQAFHCRRQIGACQKWKEVVHDITANGRDENGNAVQDGIFPLTFEIAAVQDTFQDDVLLFADNRRQAERMGLSLRPAHRTEGTQGFEVAAPQGTVSLRSSPWGCRAAGSFQTVRRWEPHRRRARLGLPGVLPGAC